MKKWIAGGRISPGSNLKKTIFASSDGSHELTAYIWDPPAAPCGVVQIIHGMREHMGRYAGVAGFFCSRGYAVCGHDHIGHGESARVGPYGYFGERDGSKALVEDCRRMTRIIRDRYPGVPVFLLGHSMGSFIGRVYITRYAGDLSGFICSGTGGGNRAAVFARALAWGLSRAGQGEKPGNLLDRLAFGNYNARHPGKSSKMAWLSRDADIVQAYEKDIHTKSLFTNRGFMDLLDLQMAACGRGWAERVPKDLPILLISGEEDPVGNYGKGVAGVYERLKKAGAENVSLKLYPGARHEVLNETNRGEVYFDVYRWMEDNKGVE